MEIKDLNLHADCIVLGSGIVGACISRALLMQGVSVTIVTPDVNDSASASLASGAMLGAFAESTYCKDHSSDKIETEFRVRCSHKYADFLSQIEQDSGKHVFKGRGTFIVGNHTGKDDLVNIRHIHDVAIAYNEPVEWVSGKEIPGFLPHQALMPHSALFLPREGFINSFDLLTAIHCIIKNSRKAKIIFNSAIKILADDSKVYGVMLDDGTEIHCNHVVVAAGLGSQRLLEPFLGLIAPKISLRGGKGSSVILDVKTPPPYVIRTPNRDFACGTHLVNRGDGTVYLGATNRISDTPGSEGGVTAGELHSLLHSGLHEMNTSYRTCNIRSFRSGQRPLVNDSYPIFGLTALEGLSVATGTYRNGILMGPEIGSIVAKEIITGACEQANCFSPSKRYLITKSALIENLLRNGIRDLISFIQEPTGSLPYARAAELEQFLYVLMTGAMTDAKNESLKIKEAIDYLNNNPQPESIPMIYYKLIEPESE